MGVARLMLCVAFGMSAVGGFAQTNEERIAATLQALLSATQAGDREAVAKVITDPFVCRNDPFDEVMDREAFLDAVGGRPNPVEVTVEELEVWVGEGAGYALAPIDLGPDTPSAIAAVRLLTFFAQIEGEWKVAAVAMLITLDENDPNAAAIRDMQPRMVTSLQEFGQGLQEVTAGRDAGAFLSLCYDDAVLGAVDGTTGQMRLMTAARLRELGDMEVPTLSASDDPGRALEFGFGTVFSAYNLDIQGPGGTRETRRHLVILSYLPTPDGGGQWAVLAAFQVPLTK